MSYNIYKDSKYLNYTYSNKIAPPSEYPTKLGFWLAENAYGDCGSLLDVGCGRGDYLEVFYKMGFDVTGIDLSPNIMDLKEKYSVAQVDLEEESYPYEEGSYDFLFSKSVIEHLRNPDNLFVNSFRVLKDEGTAVFMTPSWEHQSWGPFYIDHTHVTPFTAKSLENALRMAGFSEVKVEHFYQLPMIWKYPPLKVLARLLTLLRIPYRPFKSAPWSIKTNKVIRFSSEVMLMAVAKK